MNNVSNKCNAIMNNVIIGIMNLIVICMGFGKLKKYKNSIICIYKINQ